MKRQRTKIEVHQLISSHTQKKNYFKFQVFIHFNKRDSRTIASQEFRRKKTPLVGRMTRSSDGESRRLSAEFPSDIPGSDKDPHTVD